jgi:hypothetical protein
MFFSVSNDNNSQQTCLVLAAASCLVLAACLLLLLACFLRCVAARFVDCVACLAALKNLRCWLCPAGRHLVRRGSKSANPIAAG